LLVDADKNKAEDVKPMKLKADETNQKLLDYLRTMRHLFNSPAELLSPD
jgi:hypothetical protein